MPRKEKSRTSAILTRWSSIPDDYERVSYAQH